MTVSTAISQPFSNLQLELLNLYASNLPDEDLLKIREMLARFFFEKAKDAADAAWVKKGLTEDVILKVHRRAKFQPAHT